MSYDGSLIFDTEINTQGFQTGANKLNSIVGGLGVFKLIEKGFSLVTGSIDKAMGRIDTMEQFSRVMTTMTGDVNATNEALDETTEIVTGTAYGLDYAGRAVQNFVSRGMEIEKSTETVRAWGDAVAFYGDGSNAAFASVTDALSKMQTKGTVTMEHMEMLLNAGIPAIEMYADAIGVTAADVTDMMSSGELSASSFINTMNLAISSGTARFPSLSGAAKEAGASWGATFDNMGAAVTRGVQSIITSIDETQEALGRPTMRDAVKTFGSMFEDALKLVAAVLPPVIENVDLLTIGVGGLMLAYGANQAIKTYTKATELASLAQAAAAASGQLLVPTLDKKALAEARATAAAKLGKSATEQQIVAEMASMGVINAKTFALGGMSAGLSASTVATTLLTGATTALGTAIKVLLGPVGLIIAGLTLLGVAGAALIKWLTADTAAYKEQSGAVEGLVSAQESLKETTDSSAKSHQDKVKSLKAESDASKNLAAQITELSRKENKSAADKALLASYVEQLNAQQEGLNLAYDEEGDYLNLNAEQMNEYIDAKMAVEESNALIERQNELYQEEATLKQNLQELDEKQAELDAQLEEKAIKQSEYNELMEQLNTTREAYILQEEDIAARKEAVDAQIAELDTASAQSIIDNAEAVAAAQEEEMQRRADALQTYTEAATNMFDQIETKSEVTVGEMIANLQHNQEVLRQWSDNLVVLAQRGLDEGLLQQLRDAGPESAATVAELVNASDAELAELSTVFANGSEAATQALMTELGLPEVTNSGSEMVDDIAAGVDKNQSLEDSTVQLIKDTKAAAERQVTASNFSTIGTQMINGAIAGINAGRPSLINAMAEAAAAAYDAARRKLEINSPSRLFDRMIGLMTMTGWTRGLKRGKSGMVNQMKENVQAAIDTAGGVLSFGSRITQSMNNMRQAVVGNNLRLAHAGVAPAGMYLTNGGTVNKVFEQNIYSHDALSPAEMTTEALAAMEREEWRLP